MGLQYWIFQFLCGSNLLKENLWCLCIVMISKWPTTNPSLHLKFQPESFPGVCNLEQWPQHCFENATSDNLDEKSHFGIINVGNFFYSIKFWIHNAFSGFSVSRSSTRYNRYYVFLWSCMVASFKIFVSLFFRFIMISLNIAFNTFFSLSGASIVNSLAWYILWNFMFQPFLNISFLYKSLFSLV